MFFDNRRYDLAKVGRYKFNQKLGLAGRITGKVAFSDIINPETGEIFVNADEIISEEIAEEIQNSGINIVDIKVEDQKVRIIGYGPENIYKIIPNLVLNKINFKENVVYLTDYSLIIEDMT